MRKLDALIVGGLIGAVGFMGCASQLDYRYSNKMSDNEYERAMQFAEDAAANQTDMMERIEVPALNFENFVRCASMISKGNMSWPYGTLKKRGNIASIALFGPVTMTYVDNGNQGASDNDIVVLTVQQNGGEIYSDMSMTQVASIIPKATIEYVITKDGVKEHITQGKNESTRDVNPDDMHFKAVAFVSMHNLQEIINEEF